VQYYLLLLLIINNCRYVGIVQYCCCFCCCCWACLLRKRCGCWRCPCPSSINTHQWNWHAGLLSSDLNILLHENVLLVLGLKNPGFIFFKAQSSVFWIFVGFIVGFFG